MHRFSLTSLRVQAMLWTLVPLTLILAVVGSVGGYAYGEVVSSLVRDRDRALAVLSADRLSQNLQNQAGILEAITAEMGQASCRDRAGTFDKRKCFGVHNGVLTTVIQKCLLEGTDGPIVAPVTLLYPDGEAALSVSSVRTSVGSGGSNTCEPAYHNSLVGENYGSEFYFQEARRTGAPYFTDVLLDGPEQKPQVIVAVPILGPGDEFQGVLLGSYLLEAEQLGQDISELDVGTAYLVDSKGRVIWHPDESLLAADFSKQAPVKELLQLASTANAQQLEDAQGNQVVVGYTFVQETGWGLVIQESWAKVIDPIYKFQWIMLGALVIGLLLVMVIISSGTRRLTDPIKALVEQTEQLARGDFVGHVQGGSITEMSALSAAFNEMADRVAQYRLGLQNYVAAITQTQEDERKRIARELHDDTIQSLIALGRRLELLEQSLENPIDAAKQVYQLQQMLTRTVAEVRQFSRDLRPLLLEDLGLVAAMRQMLREMEQRDGVATELTIEGEANVEGLDDEMVVALYRIAQEALNNIHKHAHARQVQVGLTFGGDDVRLVIRDDGQGFPMAETADLARRGSFGLMGIRERAKLFGGSFELDSSPGDGTCVAIALPRTLAPDWVLQDLRELPVPA